MKTMLDMGPCQMPQKTAASSWLKRSAILVLLILGVVLVQAQSLSLSDAIQNSLENNFDIRIEASRAEIARTNNTWGAAGRWPSIALSLSNANRGSETDNPASFINGRLITIGGTARADLNWTLFNGFAVRIGKDRLDQLQAQSEGNAALVVENSLQALILAYYRVLLEEERLEVLSENLRLSRDRFAYLQTKVELGSGTTFEVLQVKTAYLTDSSSFILQELNLANAVRNLNLVMGEEPETTWELTDELKSEFKVYSEDILRDALSSNQSMKNQLINLAILNQDIKMARTALYPRLDMNLGSSFQISQIDLEGRGSATGTVYDYYANFTLSYTLFNGGNIKRSIKNAESNLQIGRLGYEDLKLQLHHEVAGGLDLYNTRGRVLKVQDAALDAADLNLNLSEDKFRSGIVNSFDLRDIQVARLASALARLEAAYNLREAEINLIRLTGGILEFTE